MLDLWKAAALAVVFTVPILFVSNPSFADSCESFVKNYNRCGGPGQVTCKTAKTHLDSCRERERVKNSKDPNLKTDTTVPKNRTDGKLR